jgi:hypothetical protein
MVFRYIKTFFYIIVRSYGRVNVITGYENGAINEKGMKIYEAVSEES